MACNYDTKYGEMGLESSWQDVTKYLLIQYLTVHRRLTIDSIEPIFL